MTMTRDSVTYVGHATVLIQLGGARLITDPWLRRTLVGGLRRHRGTGEADPDAVDAILISHLHRDHLDRPSLRRFDRSVPVVAAPGAAEVVERWGFERVTELLPGEVTTVAGARVTAVEARHPSNRLVPRVRGEAVGFLVERGARVYFAGDTELFPGMAELGGGLDLALLPVWGWGPTLGPAHLDPEDAARAAAMLKPRVAVPIHWGTLGPLGAQQLWPWLFERPARRFAEQAALLAPDVEVRALEAGESLSIAAGRQSG
jgi:L-ascorbate metabolism protein UlaG (beta-lactamase superfamily)